MIASLKMNDELLRVVENPTTPFPVKREIVERFIRDHHDVYSHSFTLEDRLRILRATGFLL